MHTSLATSSLSVDESSFHHDVYPSRLAETIVFAGFLTGYLDWIGEHVTCKL